VIPNLPFAFFQIPPSPSAISQDHTFHPEFNMSPSESSTQNTNLKACKFFAIDSMNVDARTNLFKCFFSSFKYGVGKTVPQQSCTIELFRRDLPLGWSTLPYNITHDG
jgi:hypothetical protein